MGVGLECRYLRALERIRHRTPWPDQDAINSCLIGQWGKLSPAWNKQFALDLFPNWRCSPYDEQEFEQAHSEPAIIHFCSRTKPWHAFCDHPQHAVLAFRAVLAKSPLWEDREAVPSLPRRILEPLAAPHRRLVDTLAIAVRARRRKYALTAMSTSILKLALQHPWTLFTVPLSVIYRRTLIWLRS